PIAKTTVTLDVKPWDDETDMDALTKAVRAITMDGLLWGGHQLVAVGFGIKKLQINCVVEDDKVSMDDLSDAITDLEDYVQSVDIAAMQKI
ncbi:nucleotide exchange intermediates in the Eef1a-Eef1ba complex, partial [Dichotomocladium elegans]